MKSSLRISALLAVILTVFVVTLPSECWAQGEPEAPNLVQVTVMPTNGLFWSMQITNLFPFPADPYPSLSLYTDGNGNYYYDDTSVDYSIGADVKGNRNKTGRSGGNGPKAQDEPPLPGGTNYGTNGGTGYPIAALVIPTNYVPCESFTNFALDIFANSGDVDIYITNSLASMSYNLVITTNLAQPNWTVIRTVTASNYLTFATNMAIGTNACLFFGATLTTNDLPPVITVPPTNRIVGTGSSATFTVSAFGLEPLSYQWQLNGTNLPGATATNLTISSAQATNVGIYTVVVSNVICWADASANLGLIWSNYIGAGYGIDASPAIGSNGVVYIATTGNQIYALDGATGNGKWTNTISTGGEITSSAALSADNTSVIVGSQNGYLYAFYASNGAPRWSNNLGGAIYSSPAISHSNGAIYIATSGTTNGLFAVNPTTGAIEWLLSHR